MNSPYNSGHSPYPQYRSGRYYGGHAGPVAPGAYTPPASMPYPQMAQATAPQSTPFFNVTNSTFLKGAAIGAVLAYLLTNERIQQQTIKGSVKAWALMQGGIEEIKERFRDAEAELAAANMAGE